MSHHHFQPASRFAPALLFALVALGSRAAAGNLVWHRASSGVSGTLTSVAWANDRFLAVGAGGTILSSTNGLAWKLENSGVGITFEAAGYGGGKYIVVGGVGTILTSVDAKTWTPQSSGTDLYLAGVAVGQGTVVLAGDDGTILLPPAYLGIWQSVNDTGVKYDLYDLTYGRAGFVTVGQFGRVLLSPSGTHWIHVDEVVSAYLFGVTFASGQYVAVGENGTIIRSINGMSWSSTVSGATEVLRGVAFGSSWFVVCGANGTVLSSADANSWTTEIGGTIAGLYGAAHGSGLFVLVGENGTILTGTPRRPTTLTARFGTGPGEVELGIESTPGEVVTLEHATQFTNWSDVAVFTNETGSLKMVRQRDAAAVRETFRARTP